MQNELFKQASGKVSEKTGQVVKRYTDSVDKVVSFLEENPGSDSIDIQIGTRVGIAMIGRILEKVAERRHISGIQYGYFLITE